MKKITRIIVMAMLCLNFCVNAQENKAIIKPVHVGDKVPLAFWSIKMNTIDSKEKTEIVNMETYKGKVILLDFWACWCGACILKFKDINSLQAKYKDSINFLPVNTKTTRDSHSRIVEVISGKRHAKITLDLPTVIDDEIITRYFPHSGVPHYVWIDKTGRVKAITQDFLLDERNIGLLLK